MKINLEAIECHMNLVDAGKHSIEAARLLLWQRVGKDELAGLHLTLSALYSALDRRTATRAEMLVMLWLYAPELLASRQRSRKMLDIAAAMGLKPRNACAYRQDLLFAYKTYADFRGHVDKGINAAQRKEKEVTR